MHVQQLMQTLIESVSSGASVKKVFGDPVVAGDRTVIPVAGVRYKFGAGAGRERRGETAGGGGGGRVSARPAGALEVSPEGTRFIAFGNGRNLAVSLALGFLAGAALMALKRRKPTAAAETTPAAATPQ